MWVRFACEENFFLRMWVRPRMRLFMSIDHAPCRPRRKKIPSVHGAVDEKVYIFSFPRPAGEVFL